MAISYSFPLHQRSSCNNNNKKKLAILAPKDRLKPPKASLCKKKNKKGDVRQTCWDDPYEPLRGVVQGLLCISLAHFFFMPKGFEPDPPQITLGDYIQGGIMNPLTIKTWTYDVRWTTFSSRSFITTSEAVVSFEASRSWTFSLSPTKLSWWTLTARSCA